MSASDINQKKEMFAWANGEMVDARLWAPGQPKAPATPAVNLCVDLNTDKGKLEVNGCLTESRVLCEVPTDAVNCF